MSKQPQSCGCGCGGMTKGGRFLPGHDARYHAAQKAARLAGAIAHATGGHAPAATVPLPDDPATDTPAPANAKEGRPVGSGLVEPGTAVRPGMLIRATVSGQPREGVVFDVSRFGHMAFIDGDGRQWIGYVGATWVLDTKVQRLTPAQKHGLDRMGRAIGG